MSSVFTSFLLRVMSCWNGRTFFSTMSHATVSQSSTKLRTPSPTQSGSLARMSGYFLLRSSELREKIFEIPFSVTPAAGMVLVTSTKVSVFLASWLTKWICALSPSYLYSHVNALPSNRSSTSVIDFVGRASMGFNGTPGCNLQDSLSLKIPPAFMSAGMITS